MPQDPAHRRIARHANLWATLSGFAIAGLFDGILLHRLLGWHHLLSGALPQTGAGRHFRADGAFDAAMPALLVAGLAGLLSDRRTVAAISPRCIAGMVLIGFGLRHLADALLVHWLLGLHRSHPAANSPLLWDLGWLVTFGLLPLIIGYSMRETTASSGDGT